MALFRKKRQGKWVAWLALVAMWLIIGMPVISRSLPDGMSSMELGAWCTGHGLSDHHPQTPPDPSAPTDKCGYCSLFCHSPLIGGHAGLVLLPSSLPRPLPATLTAPQGPYPHVLSARPRGPPSLT